MTTSLYRFVVATLVSGAGLLASLATAQDSQTPAMATGVSAYRAIGLGLSVALTMALSVLGAAYAVARIGSAAMGAAAEKPELLTRSILFVALAEGLAVLGFAVAIMLLQKI